MHRVKIPSDGSILATLRQIDGSELEILPAAGVALPDGFLQGWAMQDPRGASVTWQIGNRIRIQRAMERQPNAPIRFVRPHDPIDAPRLGLHIVTRTPLSEPLPPIEIRLSTTRGTNALLEGHGARVGVLVSDRLTGVIEIGDQTRDDLFARVPKRTQRIAHGVRAIPERSLADGSVDRAAGHDACVIAAASLAADDCDAIVVSLAHALSNDREAAIAAELRARGYAATAASEIARHPRLLTRTETACVHARIAPTLRAFVDDATLSAPAARAFVFTSAGVLQRADRLLARDTLYSGPAGGARAVCAVARRHGLPHAIGFDMGGTSADVSRIAGGEIALRAESRINRMTVAAPSVAIDSVAAGGGSICRFADGGYSVGPDSAGAKPGPACFGRGGPFTVTDVNLLAGRMAFDEATMALDPAAAKTAWLHVQRASGSSLLEDLGAFLDIANARMALAIESLCVRDGVDPRGHALVAFGGAGGQHACAIADRLEIDRIVFPRFAGFMSAAGVFDAPPARFCRIPVLAPIHGADHALDAARNRAIDEARAQLAADGFMDATEATIRVALRLVGQDAAIEVDDGTVDELCVRFQQRFRELFGYDAPARALEVVSVEARASAITPPSAVQRGPEDEFPARDRQPVARSVRMLSEGAWSEASVLHRSALRAGDVVTGPALVIDAGETAIVDRSWRATLDASGDLVAQRITPVARRPSAAEQELFAARLESIAVSMGNVLERTALSPNIRDRLDFSCAVLDANGTLVQNAPHLPVHLGALGVCTRAVMQALPLAEGDVAVTNHPAFGGSHLPDVTTVAPVFVDGVRVAFVAVRAHHAEIGGTRPGSFPPDAKSLAEEGVVLPPFLAVRAGEFDAGGCRARFAGGPHPSRNPDENLADLQAQVAATRYGIAQVAALAREIQPSFGERCEGELRRAEHSARRTLGSWLVESELTRSFSATLRLDDGTEISAAIASGRESEAPTRSPSRPLIGVWSPTVRHPSNFNAPVAVTRAAVLYAIRLLINRPVPMNEGLLRAFDLQIPECMLNPVFDEDPTRCPPVVAGNVETSQSVVAALVSMFGFAAESQSTMNNVLFGNERFTIYETLGGGAGAGHRRAGASAVHVHMSNTRLTDIDVLERRAPVVIRRFEIRNGSGAEGTNPGGDGLVREYEFREPVSLSFFGSRRAHAPASVQPLPGARAARTGSQWAVIDGEMRALRDGVLSLELHAGDRFGVETPGGGAYNA
jgi:5-oxoprolinase (ATP-hydrolysing)